MSSVTPSSLNIKTCFQSHYSLPFFQRDYKWEAKHFIELLTDIQSTFLREFQPSHGRKDVASYGAYFLGSIITAVDQGGKKPLIDGQQRLTSIFVILAFLERFRVEQGVKDAAELKSYIGSMNFGSMAYRLDFSSSRQGLFDIYTDTTKKEVDALAEIEDLPELDGGDKRIVEALRAIQSELDAQVLAHLPYFIDYFIERVHLIDISVPSEAEGHQVFVTMNDRGLRLGPIDLLKGKILSQIKNSDDSQKAHEAWVSTVSELKAQDGEEELFFRMMLRAKWANAMRGKSKGDPPQDYDLIGEAYHRWFVENASGLGFTKADDYVHFSVTTIPFYKAVYLFVRSAERRLVPGFEEIFFNAARKFTLQPMVLLSCVDQGDNTTDWKAKAALAAKLIDLVLTTRTFEGKENNYDNLKEFSFQLTKAVRGKNKADLLAYVHTEWDKLFPLVEKVKDLEYGGSKRNDLLYALARIADHLERQFGLTTKVGFETYWERDQGAKTFDIEHIFPEPFTPASLPPAHGFSDAAEYKSLRNKVGALILLPKARNRSLQDKPYAVKLGAYASENVLAKTLSADFYLSNPPVATYIAARPGLPLAAIGAFAKADIATRGRLYASLAQEIWAKPS